MRAADLQLSATNVPFNRPSKYLFDWYRHHRTRLVMILNTISDFSSYCTCGDEDTKVLSAPKNDGEQPDSESGEVR
jgi:hypothetical protein